MAQVYSNLIRKGLKSIEDVPAGKRAEVEAILATSE
ncbi:CD1375 family protein [Cohnella boryungensis]|uniref:CD1375 family protein n=1 Tax=Cohnella boryungensis TaxID=768479 RepID=A0ABV8S949_9BACL